MPYRSHPYRSTSRNTSVWRRFLCWLGRHDFEWGGRWLIPARAIQPFSVLESKLKCHYCSATVGPQPGQSVFDELKD